MTKFGRILFALVAASLAAAGAARAQSVPIQISYGHVPTPGQWALAFSSKQDVLGFRPVNRSGDTMLGKLLLAPSNGVNSGLNLAFGTAPATPQNGDVWMTTTGMYYRVAGLTIGPVGGGTFSTSQIITVNPLGSPTPIANTILQIVGADGTAARAEIDAFGASAFLTTARYDGTFASPTAVQSGDQISGINAWAYNGSALAGPIAHLAFYAAENITSTHQGSKACLGTTPTASTTVADSLCQWAGGGVTIGSPTGGDEGAGTLNVATLYQNGVSLGAFGSLATLTPGTGVAAALANNLNAQNGVPSIYSASITTGDCLKWGPGIQDAGVACGGSGGGGNVSNAGTPTNGQLAQWTGATTIQGITPGANVVTALEAALNGTGGLVGVNILGANVFAAEQIALNGAGGVVGVNVFGTNVFTALQTALNASGGVLSQSGALTTGDCLKAASGGGVQDAGFACAIPIVPTAWSITGGLPSSITGAATTATMTISALTAVDQTAAATISFASPISWAVTNGNAINGSADGATLQNSKTYHMYACQGASGAGAYASQVAPGTFVAANCPAGYAVRTRRLFSFQTTSVGAPIPYTADEISGGGYSAFLAAVVTDVNAATPTTGSRTLYALSVPTGLKVQWQGGIYPTNGGGFLVLTSPDEPDTAATVIFDAEYLNGGVPSSPTSLHLPITSTSAQLGVRASATVVHVTLVTRGWVDYRRN